MMEINSIHFYVTDAIRTSNWLRQKLGFQVVDRYQDADSLTIAVAYNSILLVVSAPLSDRSSVARYLANHAEGVFDLSLRVDNLQVFNQRYSYPIQRSQGINYALVQGWDGLQHSLVASTQQDRTFILPNSKLRVVGRWKTDRQDVFHWQGVDHAVLNVPQGELLSAVDYYQELFDWQVQQTFDITTERSGLFSQALSDVTGGVRFNINEPTTSNSQIQQFLDLNRGSGIQHLALQSQDLVLDVQQMRDRQVEFLTTPTVYYARLKEQLQFSSLAFCDRELNQLAQQQILLDWRPNCPQSYLRQIFTKPIFAQPTFFLEFIERQPQAQGFGKGNFQALFAAVEQEQLTY